MHLFGITLQPRQIRPFEGMSLCIKIREILADKGDGSAGPFTSVGAKRNSGKEFSRSRLTLTVLAKARTCKNTSTCPIGNLWKHDGQTGSVAGERRNIMVQRNI